MTKDSRFPVVLLWHMHQPEYRLDGRFELPWTYLHALKDYSDMAAHLEAVPQARVVVNFAPALLEQLEDYAARLAHYFADGTPLADATLDALAALPARGLPRERVARMALRIDSARQAEALPAWRHLRERLLHADTRALAELPDADLCDLVVGWHLAWMAPSVVAADPAVAAMVARGQGYSDADRATLLRTIGHCIASVLPRYRALAARGQVELSTSPYQHALLPLLIDFASAHESAPGVPLPATNYPGGTARAAWHVRQGLQTFERVFGHGAQGCWPSEAALSQSTLALFEQAGVSWVASAQSVLAGTMHAHDSSDVNPHVGYRTGGGLHCFFRDDGLSDRIGFVYKDWRAEHAVDDLVAHLERIAATDDNRMVLIALDGENAWAHYAGNGGAFVRGLYERLAHHPRLRTATLAELAADGSTGFRRLPAVRAGSWVHGQLLTWIGDAEKNRAWAMLGEAKRHFDAASAQTRSTGDSERLLAICEASDWFWWPGSINPSAAVADFDALFRAHLRALYRSLGETPPAQLHQPFARGTTGLVTAGGVMRPSFEPEPWIRRSAGVLMSVRSLPSARLDADARHFVVFAASAGFRVWQLLPIGPTDRHDNPFQPASAFAGDTALLPRTLEPDDEQAYRDFCERQQDWVDDWALFMAVKAEQGGSPWFHWPEALRHGESAALAQARIRLREPIEQTRRAQYRFSRAWDALKRYANDHGLLLFGDVPLFVAHDSADVWLHRDLFEVEADGGLQATVGVPPDAFSETGQSWGYPPYRWDVFAAQGFRWWRRRFEVQAARYDLVRIDHFRGLAAWWRIPGGAQTAIEGRWVAGPGYASVDTLRSVLGGAQLVAEDLGDITPDVIELRRDLGIPGMRVLQFAYDGDPANLHLPRYHETDSVCYTGTHDNDTTLGWWHSLPEAQRAIVARELGKPAPDMPDDLIDAALASPAPLTILPVQDLLRLGAEARMNRPGIAEGNWRWQVSPDALTPTLAAELRQRIEKNGRLS